MKGATVGASASVLSAPSGSARGMAGMARARMLARSQRHPGRLGNALPVPARFGVGANCMVRDPPLLGVRPVLLPAPLRHQGLVPGVGGKRGGSGAASSALAARQHRKGELLWNEAPGEGRTGPVFVDDRCGAWAWLAEIKLDHLRGDAGMPDVQQAGEAGHASRVLGLFPDQRTAALAYDNAVRDKRAAMNIRLSVERALQDRKPMYTVLGTSASCVPGGDPIMSIAPDTAHDLLAWSTKHKAAARRRAAREHALYTNFSIAGQLLRPPRHTRRPRVYFPAAAHPAGRSHAGVVTDSSGAGMELDRSSSSGWSFAGVGIVSAKGLPARSLSYE